MEQSNSAMYLKRIKLAAKLTSGALLSIGKRKVFCIGRNNTGISEMCQALKNLGFVIGNQRLGELLLFDYAKRDFKRLYWLCRSAQAFLDAPFRLPYTYEAVDLKFPGSKFVLTVSESAQEWYDVMIRAHSNLFGHGRVPTLEDLKEATYVYKGFMYDANRLFYNTPEEDPYNREILLETYEMHNQAILEYFKHRPSDLLVLNVKEEDACEKLCAFLGKSCPKENLFKIPQAD